MARPRMSYRELGFAKVDLNRSRRRGFPEVIYAKGKTAEQIIAITEALRRNGDPILITKVTSPVARQVLKALPWMRHFPKARIMAGPQRAGEAKPLGEAGRVLVVTAGTSDIPVAEEAVVTAQWMGRPVDRLFDVGVAGLHRLFKNYRKLRAARAIVVAAGMDGALASVLSGLVRVPIVAVPTSAGYGASFRGVGPLLAMLNSCSPGVAVVNIDNGFGAGYLAALIAGSG